MQLHFQKSGLIGCIIDYPHRKFPLLFKEGWLREAETGWCRKTSTISYHEISFFRMVKSQCDDTLILRLNENKSERTRHKAGRIRSP
jgi:hypothetical protein